MSDVMNPDGTHKLIAGYSHAAGLQERDQRMAELEEKCKLSFHDIGVISRQNDTLKAEVERLKAENRELKGLIGEAIEAEEFHYLRRKSRVHVRLGGVINNMRKALQPTKESM